MKFRFLAVAAITMMIASCSKEKNEPVIETIVTVEKPAKLLQQSSFFRDFNASFEYNADSSLSKMVTENPGYTPEVSHFSYNGNTIKQEIYRNDKIFWKSTVTLENNRVVKEHCQYINLNGEILQDNQIGYQYNAKGLLAKTLWDGGAISWEYNYNSNNDLVSRKKYYSGVFNELREYTYTNIVDKYPWFGHFSGNAWGLNKPAFATHLVKRLKVSDANGVLKGDYEYDYQVAGDGYVIGGTEYDHMLNSSHQWSNTYQ